MQKPIFTAFTFTVCYLFGMFLNNDPLNYSPELNKEIYCMAKNIYHEAAYESFEGKSAVSQVVLNRLNDPRFPKTVCEVVYQNNGKTYQFSWTGMKNRKITDQYAWEESMYIAKKAMDGCTHIGLYRKNALFYHNNKINPNWKLKKVTQIGNHIFYSEFRT